MKRLLLAAFALLFFGFGFAQIPNSSFENWYSDTGSFSFAPFVPYDTFSYASPVDWTCSNSITLSPGLHRTKLVDSTSDAYAGAEALHLRTDSIYIDSASLYLVIPGFVVNGNFPLQLGDVLGGNGINPAQIPGAGMPVNGKKQKLGFYLKYFPIPNDSCLVWAVLKKGSETVADAKFFSAQTVNSYAYFEKEFTYYSCDQPDSVAIVIASSNPNFTTLGSGNTGLNAGSELFIDSVQLFDLPNGYDFAPIAVDDNTYLFENTSKTVNELANDVDCENEPLTVTIPAQPLHGTAVLDSVQEIVYTPAANYSGKDTVIYSVSDGYSSSQASVAIIVFSSTGITNFSADKFQIFPNPASDKIFLRSTFAQPASLQLYNVQGEVIFSSSVSEGETSINTQALENGVYLLKVVEANTGSSFTKRVAVAH